MSEEIDETQDGGVKEVESEATCYAIPSLESMREVAKEEEEARDKLKSMSYQDAEQHRKDMRTLNKRVYPADESEPDHEFPWVVCCWSTHLHCTICHEWLDMRVSHFNPFLTKHSECSA